MPELQLAIIDDGVKPIYSGSVEDLPSVIDVFVDDQEVEFQLLIKSTRAIEDVYTRFGHFSFEDEVDGWEFWLEAQGNTYGNLDGEDITLTIEGFQDDPFFQFHLL